MSRFECDAFKSFDAALRFSFQNCIQSLTLLGLQFWDASIDAILRTDSSVRQIYYSIFRDFLDKQNNRRDASRECSFHPFGLVSLDVHRDTNLGCRERDGGGPRRLMLSSAVATPRGVQACCLRNRETAPMRIRSNGAHINPKGRIWTLSAQNRTTSPRTPMISRNTACELLICVWLFAGASGCCPVGRSSSRFESC